MAAISIAVALSQLRPGAKWVLTGQAVSGLVWLDAVQTRPTDLEITTISDPLDATPALSLRSQAVDQLTNDTSPNSKFIRAVLLVVLDEINIIRGLLSPSQTARTVPQLKTAVQNKINAGSAD